MRRKQVWSTWLPRAALHADIQSVLQSLKSRGLDVQGGQWNADLAKAGWMESAAPLFGVGPDLWSIVGCRNDYDADPVRYGLSLAAATIAAKRGAPVPTLVACLDACLDAASLPALLRASRCIGPPVSTWGAQAVALAMTPRSKPTEELFSFSATAHPALGQWFECGPADGLTWRGAILGVAGAELTHQGVGRRGELPERCVLEYPSKGIDIEYDGRAFSCWGVKNALTAGESYFVRVVGMPSRVLFGEFPEQDEAQLHVLQLI